MAPIKAIIFDLGKVVFDLSFYRVFEYWADLSGKEFDEIKKRFVFDDVFDKFEKNEITPEQFRTTISQRLGIQLSDEEFDNGWCNLYLSKYPGIDDLLIGLKQQFRLVALTNTNSIHNPVWRLKYADTLLHFEKIFSSHEMGTRKPERESYEIVLHYLNLQPEQTVFLDDNMENIQVAKNIGIPSILVRSTEQMKAALKELGIVI